MRLDVIAAAFVRRKCRISQSHPILPASSELVNLAAGCDSLLLWILGYGHTGDWQVQSSGVTFPDRQQAVQIAGDAGKRAGQSEWLPLPQGKHEL